jgi:hypothetical protein
MHSSFCEECDSHNVEAQGPFYANVYIVRRLYGGPAEGGWYYDAGWPVESIRFDFKEEADEAAKSQRDKYSNEGRKPIWSVASSGEYRVIVEDHFAEPWPQSKPTYE